MRGTLQARNIIYVYYVCLQDYTSRLAGLDYTVCLQSEVFVTTQGGNFPQFLEGHRRYLNNGHAKTIKPDKRTLVQVLHNTSIRFLLFSFFLSPISPVTCFNIARYNLCGGV